MFKRLIGRLRRSFENPSTPFSFIGVPNSASGMQVDEASALHHLPIYAAINRISSDIALLDPQLVERQANGSTLTAAGHPLERLISVTPNGEITADRWRQAIVAHVLAWGNSYSEIEFDDSWNPIGFWLLDPARMRVVRDPANRVVYKYQPIQGEPKDLPAWKVLHFAGLGYDGLVGYSPISLARETIGLGMAADRFGAAFFGNAARPSGMLSTPKTLSDTAAKRLRQDFEAMYAGSQNSGRVIVGEDGLTFTSISIPPNDAQFLETRKMSIEDIARLYCIPAHKIGGAVASGSIEEQNIDYLQSTLLGLCNMFEGEIALKLLRGPANERFRVTHDFKKLLKANAAARAQYNATAIQWGWATRNRVAQDEGYEPYTGGEAPLLPLNMVQVGPDGQPLPNPTPPQPATPTTSGTASSDTSVTALAGIVRHLLDRQSEARSAPVPTTAAATVAVDTLARAELARAMRREAAAIRRAAEKPGFREAVETLCAEHREYLADAMAPAFAALKAVDVPVDAAGFAAEWIERSKSDLLALEAVTTKDQRPAAVAELLDGWRSRIDTAWELTKKNAAS